MASLVAASTPSAHRAGCAAVGRSGMPLRPGCVMVGQRNAVSRPSQREAPMQDRLEKQAPRTLRLNARDNIMVAVDRIDPGTTTQGVTATARIMRGHKVAAEPIAKGQPVLKFGQIIGFATEDIRPGAHVHTHNCSFAEFERDHAFAEESREEPLLPSEARATFEGFRRANGKAGTRNYLGILTSVNCSASVARFIAEAVNRAGVLDQYPNVDGVVSFVHGTGCGLAG